MKTQRDKDWEALVASHPGIAAQFEEWSKQAYTPEKLRELLPIVMELNREYEKAQQRRTKKKPTTKKKSTTKKKPRK
jgi:hypothetical protein